MEYGDTHPEAERVQIALMRAAPPWRKLALLGQLNATVKALALEEMPEVVRYVKNHHLGFTISYTLNGEEHQYTPDFIACIDDGHGRDDPLNLIIEVSGETKKDKAAKVATARTLWVPAVNNHGGFGRWDFIEIRDPWNAENALRARLRGEKGE